MSSLLVPSVMSCIVFIDIFDLRFLFRILIYLNVIFFFKILVLFHCVLCLRKPSSFHSHRVFTYYTFKSIF